MIIFIIIIFFDITLISFILSILFYIQPEMGFSNSVKETVERFNAGIIQ